MKRTALYDKHVALNKPASFSELAPRFEATHAHSDHTQAKAVLGFKP